MARGHVSHQLSVAPNVGKKDGDFLLLAVHAQRAFFRRRNDLLHYLGRGLAIEEANDLPLFTLLKDDAVAQPGYQGQGDSQIGVEHIQQQAVKIESERGRQKIRESR